MALRYCLFIVTLTICLSQGQLLLKARGHGGSGGSVDNSDTSSTLPLQYGFEEETHYISDSTFTIINETLSPFEPQTEAELEALKTGITERITVKKQEKLDIGYILLKETDELDAVIAQELNPYKVAVEEAKVALTELKIELNEAEIVTYINMVHYINEVLEDKDLKPRRPMYELTHIFVIKEYIVKDQIEMAKMDLNLAQAQLKYRNDRAAMKGADTIAEDNAAISNAKDGYAIAEASYNTHSENYTKHTKHYAYFHAGNAGSVLYLLIGYIILFYVSNFITDRYFNHDCPDQQCEGGKCDPQTSLIKQKSVSNVESSDDNSYYKF